MYDPHVLKIPEGMFKAQKSKADALKYLLETGHCPYCLAISYITPTEKEAKEHIDRHVLP